MNSLLRTISGQRSVRAESRGSRSREAGPAPRLRTAALFGALIAAVVMLLHHTTPTGVSLLWRLELLSYDWRISLQEPVTPEDIVIVAIDHESITNYGAWPWPRALHAQLLNRLADARARVIGLDIVFSDVSSGIDLTSDDWLSEKLLSGDDEELRAAIARAGTVVLAAEINESEQERGDIETTVTSASFPHEDFKEAAAAVGIVNFDKDVDSAIRRIVVSREYQDETWPSLAAAVYKAATGDPGLPDDLSASAPHLYLPEGTVLINYTGPARTVTTIPYYQAITPELVGDETFRDKIVLIGGTAPLLQDIHLSPVRGRQSAEMPGVEVQANSILTLLSHRFLWPVPVWVTWLLTLAVAVGAALGTASIRPIVVVPTVIVPLLLLLVGVPTWLLVTMGVWVPVVAPLSAMLLSYASVAVYMYLVEARARQAIRAAWQRRVAPEVLDVILRDPKLAYVSGRRTVATALFSDIRGFTTMCDEMEPEGVVEMLNEYLSEMTKVIRRQGGTIHKFIGDGIMAVFGDPIPNDDHADQALVAALEMHKRLSEMRFTSQNACIRQVHIGVGIHTGDLVAGDLGSDEFMEYTVIGRTVSLASRLESMNKEFSTGIIISGDTRAHLKHEYEMTPLGPTEIRGVADAIELYAVTLPERQPVHVTPLADEGQT